METYTWENKKYRDEVLGGAVIVVETAHDDHGEGDAQYDEEGQGGGQQDDEPSRGPEHQTEETAYHP